MKLRLIYKHAWRVEDSADANLAKSLRFKRVITIDDVIALVCLKCRDRSRNSPLKKPARAVHALPDFRICGQENLISPEEIELIRAAYLNNDASSNLLDDKCSPSLASLNEILLLSADSTIFLRYHWDTDHFIISTPNEVDCRVDASEAGYCEIVKAFALVFQESTQPTEERVNLRLICWTQLKPQLFCFTGARFGCNDAIYPDHPDISHSAYLHVDTGATWLDLLALSRIASNNRKRLAVSVDQTLISLKNFSLD